MIEFDSRKILQREKKKENRQIKIDLMFNIKNRLFEFLHLRLKTLFKIQTSQKLGWYKRRWGLEIKQFYYTEDGRVIGDLDKIREKLSNEFHAAHKKAYGYDMQDQAIQSIYIGASAAIPVKNIEYKPFSTKNKSTPTQRKIWVSSNKQATAKIYNREYLVPGFKDIGPLIVEENDSTTYAPPGSTLEIDSSYAIIIEQTNNE